MVLSPTQNLKHTAVVRLLHRQAWSQNGLKVRLLHGPALPGDVHTTKADISLARNLLGWKPKIFIKEWLKEAISDKTNLDSIID